MKIYKLKKNIIFSLIALMFCCVLFYSANNSLNIVGFINTNIELIKEKEMKFIYGEKNTLGDKFSESSADYNISNVNYKQNELKPAENTLKSNSDYSQQEYLLLENKIVNANKSMSKYIASYTEYQAISAELKKQIEVDSYRNKELGFYYIFDYEYTMDALKELEPEIEKIAKAQKMPKALISSVLFREMMFMGQEDLLDGLPVIGGKSMGICQIGIENVRFNENTVHGKKSLISDKTDDQIRVMLQNPKQAIYFCAVQLRARAINLTGNNNVDLNELNAEQIHKIYEEYNQSKITKTVGPIKTKSKYAEETYKYYKLFLKYYELEAAIK
ncbi:MAG: hypothetical protein ACYDG2_13050 [Ruminiclostridium sp.]